MTVDTPARERARRGLLAALAWLICAAALPAVPLRAADPPAGSETIESLWSRGETARKTGSIEEALRLFDAALARDQRRARSWNYLGGAYFEQGDFSRALEKFRTALELDPNDVRACNNVGTALERLGDYANAEAAYIRATLIDPAYPHSYRNLGILQSRRLGKPDAARRAWERYLALAPDGARSDQIRAELSALPASTPLRADEPAPGPAPLPAPAIEHAPEPSPGSAVDPPPR